MGNSARPTDTSLGRLWRVREYVLKKLLLSDAEFEEIMNAPVKSYRDYPSYATLVARVRGVGNFLARIGVIPERIGF